ncbi:DUF2842 domain-containing protein [Sphingorhabdus sp. SMR4y]|uniref:DUF2842 domain-containing protein n=1 Tax=Sphingorhabdus sp. SMR4y TaxID=2584094 RepID=UPI0028C3F621|nr:DUF2842 domain-containing protein [Sphingorhabdus sp. SMR4y]
MRQNDAMTPETESKPNDHPSWRKPAGMILILLLILLWCGIAVTLIEKIDMLHFWLQLPVYVILGIAWIFPMRPLLTWMNTGSWRHFPENKGNGASDET